MGAFPSTSSYSKVPASIYRDKRPDWLGTAVGGAFLVGALLLLSGKKRAGMVVTSTATALTLLDQKDTVREWWNTLPGYLDDAQRLLDQAQHVVDDLALQRDRLRTMFNK